MIARSVGRAATVLAAGIAAAGVGSGAGGSVLGGLALRGIVLDRALRPTFCVRPTARDEATLAAGRLRGATPDRVRGALREGLRLHLRGRGVGDTTNVVAVVRCVGASASVLDRPASRLPMI